MNVIKKAVNLLLPANCCICHGKGVSHENIPFEMPENLYLCSSCLSKLVPVPMDKRWLLCLSEPYDSDPYKGLTLYMPFPYDDFFGAAVPMIKFKGKYELAVFLGQLLGGIMKQEGIQADVVVPVPLSEKRFSERGFNQAELIAGGVAEKLGLTVCTECLVRTRHTERQTGLSENSERSANIEGAFAVKNACPVEGKTVLLVDDVATTGQTLHEAACQLLDNGADKVLCTALCGNRNVKNADPF